MMEENKSPNSLSKVKVLVGLGVVIALVGVFGVASMFGVLSKVEISNLMVTNQTSNSASIVWTTDKKADVGVEVSQTPDFATSVKYYDDRDVEEVGVGQYELVKGVKREIHHVTVRNLDPEQVYYFRLVNNGNKSDVADQRIATTKTVDNLKTPDPVYGIVDKTEGSNVEEGVVMMQKVSTDAKSQTISTALENGSYSLDLANLMDVNLKEEFAGKDYVEEINVIGLDGKVLNAKVIVDSEMDQPVENITLGVDKVVEKSDDSQVQVQAEEKYGNSAIDNNCCNVPNWSGRPANGCQGDDWKVGYVACVEQGQCGCTLKSAGQQPVVDPNGNAPEVPPCTAKLGNPEQCQSPEENNNCVSLGEYNITDQKGTYASYNCVDKEVRVNRTRHPNGICNYTFVNCVKGVNPGAAPVSACNYGDTARNFPASNTPAAGKTTYDGSCWVASIGKDICRYNDKCGTTTIGTCTCGTKTIKSGETCLEESAKCTGTAPVQPAQPVQPGQPANPAQPAQPADPGTKPEPPIDKPVVLPNVCTFSDADRGSNTPAANGKFDGSCWIKSARQDNCRKGDKCGNGSSTPCTCGNGTINPGEICNDEEVNCAPAAVAPPAAGGEAGAPVEPVAGNTVQEVNIDGDVNINVTQVTVIIPAGFEFTISPLLAKKIDNILKTAKEITATVTAKYDNKGLVEVDNICIGWFILDDLPTVSSEAVSRIPSVSAPETCDTTTAEGSGMVVPIAPDDALVPGASSTGGSTKTPSTKSKEPPITLSDFVDAERASLFKLYIYCFSNPSIEGCSGVKPGIDSLKDLAKKAEVETTEISKITIEWADSWMKYFAYCKSNPSNPICPKTPATSSAPVGLYVTPEMQAIYDLIAKARTDTSTSLPIYLKNSIDALNKILAYCKENPTDLTCIEISKSITTSAIRAIAVKAKVEPEVIGAMSDDVLSKGYELYSEFCKVNPKSPFCSAGGIAKPVPVVPDTSTSDSVGTGDDSVAIAEIEKIKAKAIASLGSFVGEGPMSDLSSITWTDNGGDGNVMAKFRQEFTDLGVNLQQDSNDPLRFKVVNGTSQNIIQFANTFNVKGLDSGVVFRVLGRVDNTVNAYYKGSKYILAVDSNGLEFWIQNPFRDDIYNRLSIPISGVINFYPRIISSEYWVRSIRLFLSNRVKFDELIKLPLINYYNIAPDSELVAEDGKFDIVIASESDGMLEPGKYNVASTNVTTKEFTLTTPGQVVYFQDLNGDGVKQDNEPLYDGDVASLNIEFNKVSEVQSYEIKNGWNLVSFPILMRGDGTSNLVKASDLIKKLNDSNIVATHVITYRSGKFVLYSFRKNEQGQEFKFGEDFSLLPGEGYFIRSYSAGSLLVDGNKIQNSQEIAVENGWNLVGFYNSNKLSYGGFDVLTQVSTAGITSDSLSKWEDGMYYSIISQNGKQYGNDFKVYPTQGYFLRVSNKGVGKFAPN